jgi:hypothetical protein
MSLFPPFFPPAYPTTDPPPAPYKEQLLANGLDLGSWCHMPDDISGLFNVPERRGENVPVPGRHGRIKTPRKKFDSVDHVLPLWIVGCRPDGTVPFDGTQREFYRRRDELLQVLYADELELSFRRPDGTVLTAIAEVTEALDFTRRRVQPVALVNVALTICDPFWVEELDVSQVITGVTGTTATLTAFTGSTAPISDAVITFQGPVSNPRLAVGDRYVRYNGVIPAGKELVLECEHWRANSGNGAAWDPDERQVYREPGPCWLEIPASRTPLTATWTHTGGGNATVEIAGRRKFLAP